MDKTNLRKTMSAKRELLSYSERRNAEFAAALNLDKLLKKYSEIFIYNSVRAELSTVEAVRILVGEGKHISFPKVKGEIMEAFKPTTGAFKRGAFDIFEPENGEKVEREKIEACILPGLAFDLRGFRVGYGKGYYDRFLKELSCVKIGYCYDFQLTKEVDEDGFDVACDYIVTDKKIYLCGENNGKNKTLSKNSLAML